MSQLFGAMDSALERGVASSRKVREGTKAWFLGKPDLRCSYPDTANISVFNSVKNSVIPTNGNVTGFCPKSGGRVFEQRKNSVITGNRKDLGPDCGVSFFGVAAGTFFRHKTWYLVPVATGMLCAWKRLCAPAVSYYQPFCSFSDIFIQA